MSNNTFSRDETMAQLFEEMRIYSTQTVLLHESIAEKLELNLTDHKALDVLTNNLGITAGRLAELTGLTTGTVTGVLDRLERKGYVKRIKDPQDKRRVIIQVNEEKTAKDFSPIFDQLKENTRKALSQFDEQELQIIQRYLRQINQTYTPD